MKNDFGGDTLFKRIRDYLNVYLPKRRNYSEHTLRSYKHAIDLLLDFIKDRNHISLDKATFDLVTADAINAYLDYVEKKNAAALYRREILALPLSAPFLFLPPNVTLRRCSA
jgi:site-specific recombinase XerD